MKNVLLFASSLSLMLFLFISCEQDNIINVNNKENELSFTREELLCIKDDIVKDLSETEIIDLVRDFTKPIIQTGTRNFNFSKDISIQDKFYIYVDNSISTRSLEKDRDSILIYKLSLSNNDTSGFSLVSPDKRASGVIAYVPDGDLKDTIENKGLAEMINASRQILETGIINYNIVIDSLKELTINKICEAENIKKEEYNTSHSLKYAKSDYLLNNDSPQTRVIGIANMYKSYGPYLSTQWNQDYPYNAQVDFMCPTVASSYKGRAPAGCVAIATGQILNYFEKQPEKASTTYNYSLFSKYTKVPTYDTQAVSEVSRFIKDIGKDVAMQYGCKGSLAYSFNAVFPVLSVKYGLYVKNIPSLESVFDFALAFSKEKVIYVSGTDDENGGHAWVIDGGYGRGIGWYYDPDDYYVHCNFGWGGKDDGYFLIKCDKTGRDYIDPGKFKFESLQGWAISAKKDEEISFIP